MPKPYRSSSRLVLDVLRVLRDEGEVSVTRLLEKANLTHARVTAQLEDLAAKGWVEPVEQGDRKAWRLTAQGRSVLLGLERIDRSMQDFGLVL